MATLPPVSPALLRIVHLASEVAPWAQTGGLADVASALPLAQQDLASHARTVVAVPLYRSARLRLEAAHVALTYGPWHDVTLGIHQHRVRVATQAADRTSAHHTPEIRWIDIPALFDRDGIYGPPGGGDFLDNHVRFAVFCRAVVNAALSWFDAPPDVVHAHDWQAALALMLIRVDHEQRGGWRPATVATIHNLAFRGIYPKSVVGEFALPWTWFTAARAEFWDQFSFLKAGLAAADAITTVSPSYAREILGPETGEGFDGFLRHDSVAVEGVVNGIDDRSWNPATDPALPAPFGVVVSKSRSRKKLDIDDSAMAGKAVCRDALAAEFGFVVDAKTPIAAVVSRLSSQKGLDLVADLAPSMRAIGMRLIVLGAGDHNLENRFRALAEEFPDCIAVRIGFEAALARRIYGGADLFLMPSRFEPCGLGQLYALRYGTVPVVRAVGGLRDTVEDMVIETIRGRPPKTTVAVRGNGFRFEHDGIDGLRWAVTRAVSIYRDQPSVFAALRRNAMARDSSWQASAGTYLAIYDRLLAELR